MNIYPGYERWSTLDLLTGLIYGEGRSEVSAAKVGMGLTVRTRVLYPRWWGTDYRSVILCDKQFTCWEDHNVLEIKKAYAKHDTEWLGCWSIANNIIKGITDDAIGKPTHYHTTDCSPNWTQSMIKLCQIGKTIFYHDPSVRK